MVGVQSLDHGLAFLKNLLKVPETEDLEMNQQEPGPSTSRTVSRRSVLTEKWGFQFDIAELEKCLAMLKTHCEKTNELIKYTTSVAWVPC